MIETTNALFTIHGFSITLADIASIATAISMFIGIFQLAAGRKDRKENAKRVAVKEAVDIAKVFQKEILDDLVFVLSVYREIGLEEYINSILPKDQILSFTKEEATAYFHKECGEIYDSYRKKIDHKTLDKALIINTNFRIKAMKKVSSEYPDEKLDEKIAFHNKKAVLFRARDDVLNKLEWAAMMINSNAADGRVIYQSMHQTICSFVRANYLHIASLNTDSNACDQFYTNLTDLYNSWIGEFCSKQKQNEKRLKNQKKRTEKIQKQYERDRKRTLVKPPKM